MFEASVSRFVKEVGRESLIPVPSLDEANLCRPLQVVVKKNRRWFWQSAKYEPTPFSINQLLVGKDELTDVMDKLTVKDDITDVKDEITAAKDDEPVDVKDELTAVKIESRTLATYNRTHQFNVKGRTGAKLVSLIDLELDASDKISVEAKFGEITKQEVDQPALLEKLAQGQLDLKHEFIEQVRADKRKTLCVVVGTALLAKDGSVHMHINKDGEVKEDIDTKVKVDENADAEIGDDADKQLVIPAGTPLAYNVCEILVSPEGQLELMVEDGTLGGFAPSEDDDSVDGYLNEYILDALTLEDQYQLLTNLKGDEKLDLTTAIFNVCNTPVDVPTILQLMKEGVRNCVGDGTSLKVDGAEKTGELKVQGSREDAQTVLRKGGFDFKEDGTLIYPAAASQMLECLRGLFEALIELDDEVIAALTRCTTKQAEAIVLVIKTTLLGDPIGLMDDHDIAVLYSTPENSGRKFLETLGFAVNDKNDLTTSLDNRAELEGAVRAVFALLWQPKKSSCVIL